MEESSLPFFKKIIWDTHCRKDPYICVSIPFLHISGEKGDKSWRDEVFCLQYSMIYSQNLPILAGFSDFLNYQQVCKYMIMKSLLLHFLASP